jgi:type VI secretion system protein VasG
MDTRTFLRDATPSLRRAWHEALEAGVALGHGEIALDHLFLALLDRADSDFSHILAHFGVNRGDLERQFRRSLAAMAPTSRGQPAVAEPLATLIQAARSHTISSGPLRSGLVLLAFMEAPRRFGTVIGTWPALARVVPETLWQDFDSITQGSGEQAEARRGQAAPPAVADVLTRFTRDLTAEARAGRIDPIHGRHAELHQLIQILGRRRQNNPILVGEAGVGKTAVVEALALRIAGGEVPPALKRVTLLVLDMALLQANAGMRGEFEARLTAVVDAVEAATSPIILFLDEAHSMVGAGGAAGQGDAATLLKPALARGTLRLVAATTWKEYKRFLEKDPALTRRFQQVRIDEPDEATAVEMLTALTGRLARHHDVSILPEAIGAAVTLSQRHVPNQRLPDKAISVLDTACSLTALARVAPPLGADEALRRRWAEEKALVEALTRADDPALLQQQLDRLQGDSPLVPQAVDLRMVARVIADWSGLSLDTVLARDDHSLDDLDRRLDEAVLGQPAAVQAIARRLRLDRAALEARRGPAGVFLLAGPDGVGKRHAAHCVTELLGRMPVLALDMTEYQESHSLSALRGAPVGYVGHGDGGLLTEAVRRIPHQVILVENAERAHPNIQALLAQMCDSGRIDDSDGIPVDFRACTVFLSVHTDPSPTPEALRRRLVPLLGRLADLAEPVPFDLLSPTALAEIARRRLEQVVAHGRALIWDQQVLDALAAEAASSGRARALGTIIERRILEPLSRLGVGSEAVTLRVTSGGIQVGQQEGSAPLSTAIPRPRQPPAPPPTGDDAHRLWHNWR